MGRTKETRPVDLVVGHNIRICRLQRRLSQSELGSRIGVTFQQIQKYENGGNRVSASRMMLIAEVLGVPISSLFDGSATAGRPEPLDSALSLLAKPHSLRLVQAFDRLPKDVTRLAIVRLVEAVGRQGFRRGAPKQSRGRSSR
jgi:transcriptional regulator with XRE-family HTH domain